MKKIIYYIKKIFNKAILFCFLLFLLLFLGFVLHSCNNKERNEYLKKEKEERQLVYDIKTTTDEEVFPKVDLNTNGILDELKKNIEENFLYFNYKYNKNKNVIFNILLPKSWNATTTSEKEQDPFDFTDEKSIILLEIKNEGLKINGKILVLNTTLELNPTNINLFVLENMLKLKTIKGAGGGLVTGFWSDFLAINPENGEITRIKTFRNASLYYTIYFTFKDFYDYMQHAKDVSIIFESFNLTNRLKNLSSMEFDLLKTDKFEVLYPKNWKTEWGYPKDKTKMWFYLYSPNEDTVFNIRSYDYTDKTNKELAEDRLDSLKNALEITFDGIDTATELYDSNRYVFKLLNAKNPKGKPIDIYVSIISKDNKKIVGTLITNKLETNSFLPYKEYERILDILMTTIQVSFLDGIKLEDTDWINLYYKYNNKVDINKEKNQQDKR